MALFGLTGSLWLAVLFLAVAGAGDLVSSVYRSSMLQTVATDEMRGRMQGVFIVVVAGGPRLADMWHGPAAADRTGRGRDRRRGRGRRRRDRGGGAVPGVLALPRAAGMTAVYRNDRQDVTPATDGAHHSRMAETAAGRKRTEHTELKRAIGPKLLLFFVIGDILGTGIYALTGSVAGRDRRRAVAAVPAGLRVAFLTAFSYLELVGKYPRAAGAALYTHKAFGINFLTFMVTFTVMALRGDLGGHRGEGVRRHLPAAVRRAAHLGGRRGLHPAASR